jgi:hypothetical protein
MLEEKKGECIAMIIYFCQGWCLDGQRQNFMVSHPSLTNLLFDGKE